MKRFTWNDLIVCCFCFGILCAMGGYGWRMYHESLCPKVINVGMIQLADLSMEIDKGKEFWLPIDNDTMLHFLPLRKARYEMAIRREKR